MTVDRLPQNLRENSGRHDREHGGLAPTRILSICDHVVGEVGRRSHMFAWLRVPGSGAGADHPQWLSVDAYYPRARLVVMCRTAPGPHDALYRQLIPAHGLGLLTLDPEALGDDPAEVQAALEARISGRNFSLASVSSQAPRNRSAERTRSAEWTPVTVERTPVPAAVQQGLGVVVGMALAVGLMVELYLAVVAVGLQAGRPLLGLAIALEACARGLGTVAAERAGERGWACACAIGGAPVVAWFALAPRPRRAEAEPAPLAGLLALLAGVIALVALAIGS
jgi:hypothetical protein